MTDRPVSSWPEQAAIAMIAVPVALFFATWFQPLLGLPSAAVVIWIAWKLSRSVSPAPLPSRGAMMLLAIMALLWTWEAGIGGFFQQMPDHNFRNALLHDLIDHSWPVAWNTPQGMVVLDYYLGWSLIPALVGKVLGWKAATLAMAAVCGAGVFLVLLIFVRVVGIWRWWIPLVFVLWSGMDIVGWALRTRFSFEGLQYIGMWSYPPLWYLSNMMNFFCVPHLSIPTWLITFMVAGRRIGPAGMVGLAAFLFPLAPYQTVGLAPFVAWGILQGDGRLSERLRKALTVENLVLPLVVLAMCTPLYLGNAGAGRGSGWFYENSPSSISPWGIFVVFLVMEVLAVGVAIWVCGQRDRLVLLAMVVLCLIPLRQSGLSNDLALKVSMPGLAILAVFTAKALISGTRGWARWVLIAVFALGAVTPIHESWLSARWTLTNPRSLEEDAILTFDPVSPPNNAYVRLRDNFRSRPLDGLPLLRWMLGSRAQN